MKFHFLAWSNRDIICIKALVDSGNSGTRTVCVESIEPPSGGSNGDAEFDARWTQTISTGTHTIRLDFNTSNPSGVQVPQALSGEDGSQLCVYDNR